MRTRFFPTHGSFLKTVVAQALNSSTREAEAEGSLHSKLAWSRASSRIATEKCSGLAKELFTLTRFQAHTDVLSFEAALGWPQT